MSTLCQLSEALIVATWIAFLYGRGYSLWEIGMAQAVFSLVVMLAEIPSGAFADSVGRRVALSVGAGIRALGLVVYAWSPGFVEVILAAMMTGLGSAFASGSLEAWVVDSLEAAYGEGSRHLGRVFSTSSTLGIVSSLIGGYLGAAHLASLSGVLPFYASAFGFCLVSILSLIVLDESPRRPVVGGAGIKAHVKSLAGNVAEAFIALGRDKTLALVVLSTLPLAVFLQGPGTQWQPFFREVFENQQILGYLWLLISGAGAIGAFLARFVTKWPALPVLAFAIIGNALCVIATVLARSPALAVLCFGAHVLLTAFDGPIRTAFTNELIAASQRATLVSVREALGGFAAMLGSLLLGAIASSWSIEVAWISASVFLIGSVPVLQVANAYQRRIRGDAMERRT